MDVHRSGMTRRQWLTLSAAAATQGVLARPGYASMPQVTSRRVWGVQLYTVRGQLAADAAATLERIAAIGYTELEALQPTLPVVAPLARQFGLSIVSVHLDAPTARGEGFETLLAQAGKLGIETVIVPFVPPTERPNDRAGFEALGARLSRMARTAAAAGLQLGYHNHAFEFGRDRDGMRWLDVLMQTTARYAVRLQLDVFWAAVAGADPVALIRQYPGRMASLHLKDRDPKSATTLVETEVPRTAFVEVGSGALDFRAILSAAREAGVQHFFVEQDQTPGDPVESLAKSFTYLSSLSAG